jgi:phosphoribosylformylglycinamidine cyclo-ligase
MSQKISYAEAGVNIDAGEALVERIKPFAKATARKGTDSALGGFGGLFDLSSLGYKEPVLVSGTDGVGTKLKVAQSIGKHDTIGIDLVAMCVNDIVVQGAEPLFFLDYFACGKLDVDVAADVVKGIAEGCKMAGCALVGGETAEMPGMYATGEYDLAGFTVGVVEKKQILPRNDIKAGDVVIGLASSGIHSNGYSLVRYIIEKAGLSYDSHAPFAADKTIGEAILTPTRIYVSSALKAIKTGHVKALAHITGGGLTDNLPRVLQDGISLKINPNSWELPNIFKWLQEKGNVEHSEMLRTFNCGIGMVVIVSPDQVDTAIKSLTAQGLNAWTVGEVVERPKNAPQTIVI